MKLNIHILFDELKEFSPQLATCRDIDLTLRQIRLPEFPIDNLQKDCIYLLEASSIMEYAQLLNDIDLISIGPIDSQNVKHSNLSVISLSNDCNKAAVFNKIQDIFEKYAQWDFSLMRSIASHESLQVVSDQAASILDNPFALVDITLKRILKGGVLPADYSGTIWEVVMNQEYTPSETFSLSTDALYFFLNHDKKPYFNYDLPYKPYSHLIANLHLNGKLFALLCTTDINGPLTQGQVSLIQHIRDVMELAISSSIEFKGSTEIVIYYLEKLIKGLPVDDKIISYHLNQRGWSIRDSFRVFTITNPDGKELSDSQMKFCLFRIKKLWEDVILFSFENSIIVITRQSKIEINRKYTEDLTTLLSKLGLHCGCSHIFDHFGDLKYYYIQSKAALYEGEKNNPDNILWNFGDYYFSHIVSLLDHSTSLKSMCHPNILRLLVHDNTFGTDFVQSLRIYLYNGCNIAQTGKELFMHRNTLTYRLERIAEIIEMDVPQLRENERMQLWFSCWICSYL